MLAVAIVAVAVQPAYSVLRRTIERWVYGYRSDPAAALRRLGARLESADPLHVVEAISASVRDALKVERVWVSPPDAELPTDPCTVQVPVGAPGRAHRPSRGGGARRAAGSRRRTRALLRDLARQAAVTVRAAQLAEDLQTSRSRDRLRPRRRSANAFAASCTTASGRPWQRSCSSSRPPGRARTPPSRDALLTEISDETKAAITEVRRAVDELRPPAIDEVGLAGAIRQRAASLTTGDLVFEMCPAPNLPPMPAASRSRRSGSPRRP